MDFIEDTIKETEGEYMWYVCDVHVTNLWQAPNSPGVYARVSQYMDFIEDTIKDTEGEYMWYACDAHDRHMWCDSHVIDMWQA